LGLEDEKEAVPPSQIHIRVQQRNGRKCVTTVQGFAPELDLERIKRAMCKRFSCGGSLVGKKASGGKKGPQDFECQRDFPRPERKREKSTPFESDDEEEEDPVIQLTGDQRKNCADFLAAEEIASKEDIIIHGF